jgi:phytoene dehydrogenase-like protein
MTQQSSINIDQPADVIVVGGGLAGLTVATLLARAGRMVTLFEKSRQLGGRGMTQVENGFHFNLGPHALYRRGAAAAILGELGIRFSGGVPGLAGNYAIRQGSLYSLPVNPLSILTTRFMSFKAKVEAVRRLASLMSLQTQSLQEITVQEWLQTNIRQPEVRQFFAAALRVSTYTNAPQRQSAGSALAQLQSALAGNVWYLDGGWQTLTDGLIQAAQTAGVKLVTGARVASVKRDEWGAVCGLRLAEGSWYTAPAVVVAAEPQMVCDLVEGGRETVLRRWAEEAIPVQVANLEVGLKGLPQPKRLIALGMDQPLYYSTHSAYAKLAPEGKVLIHLAKYLDPDLETDPRADEQELEALLDLVQPGWRQEVIVRRFLPRLTASQALVTAAQGGQGGRPGPEVPGIPSLYVVGDWVGPVGLLADAALASAKQAAELVLTKPLEGYRLNAEPFLSQVETDPVGQRYPEKV